jgi:hypothetical protein
MDLNSLLAALGDGDPSRGLQIAWEERDGSDFHAFIAELAAGSLTVIVDQFGAVWMENGKAMTTRDLAYFGG